MSYSHTKVANPRRKRVNGGDTVSSVPAPRVRDQGFAIRWTAAERAAIEARAAEHDMKIGPYMIAAAMGTLPAIETDRDRRLAELEERVERIERLQELGA